MSTPAADFKALASLAIPVQLLICCTDLKDPLWIFEPKSSFTLKACVFDGFTCFTHKLQVIYTSHVYV